MIRWRRLLLVSILAAVVGVLLALAVPADAADVRPTPIERGAVVSPDMTRGQIYALAAMARLFGYRCDSVSAARPWALSYGFTVVCNRFRYTYEVQDRGGRWTVTVK